MCIFVMGMGELEGNDVSYGNYQSSEAYFTQFFRCELGTLRIFSFT